MHVVIRVDAGGKHGIGRWRRMQAVAAAMRERDPNTCVYYATRTPDIIEAEADDQDEIILLDHNRESQALRYIADLHPGGILVIDTTDRIDPDVLRVLREMVRVVRVDQPWAEEDTADLVVIPNMHQEADTVATLDETFGDALMYGPEAVIIASYLSRWASRRERHVVFFAGSTDPDSLMPNLMGMTQDLKPVRPLYKYFLIGKHNGPFTFKEIGVDTVITSFSHGHLRYAALAVGPLSQTAYECIMMGTPLITFGRNAHDAICAEQLALATHGACVSLDEAKGLMRETLCGEIERLWHDNAARQAMHDASYGLIDGNGALRVAERILALGG